MAAGCVATKKLGHGNLLEILGSRSMTLGVIASLAFDAMK